MSAEAAVSVAGLTKRYPGVLALDDVDLEVRAGEVHVLLGENGAGKSTLVKILSGAVQADAGSVLVAGSTAVLSSPHAAQQAGISTVHQELSLVPDLTVAQNLFLGRELTRHGVLDTSAMERQSEQWLGALGVAVSPRRRVRSLSLAVQQMIEIARALSRRPRLLILDEPTSSLSEQETEELFVRVRQIQAEGVGVVYISHRLEELARIADRVTVMRDGRVVAPALPASTPLPELVRLMVGRDVAEEFPTRENEPGEVLLRVERLSVPGVLHDISFSVRAGEVVGVFGLVGSGRTELLRAVYGLDASTGTVELGGRRATRRTPRRSLDDGLALVPEDRHGWGLVMPLSIRQNISLSSMRECAPRGLLSRSRVSGLADRYMRSLRIKAPSASTGVVALSGGNQQKVVLARALAVGPSVLLLDEPTRGVDAGAKMEIYELIAQLATDGKGVVVVSSELPEVLGLSDRVLVMRGGQLSGEFPRGQADPEVLLNAALSHDQGAA